MKTTSALALLTAVVLAFCAIPANAQPYNRTWVSQSGSTSSTCGLPTSPCTSFAAALTNTVAGGEIDCLGPGDFEAVTITKSVSIVCDGVSNGGILTSGQSSTAIAINGTTGTVVYLSGLDLNGLAGTGQFGVDVSSGSTVYIVHSTIRGFSFAGVGVSSTTNPTRVVIKDSTIVNNGSGVLVTASEGATNAAIIVNTVIDGNTDVAAGGNGSDGTSVITLEGTTLSGSPYGLSLINGASAVLVGPSNAIAGTIEGPTTSVSFK